MNPRIPISHLMGEDTQLVSRKQIDEIVCGLIKGRQKEELLKKIETCPESKHYYDALNTLLADAAASKERIKKQVFQTVRNDSRLAFFQRPSTSTPLIPKFAFSMSLGVACIFFFYFLSNSDNKQRQDITMKGAAVSEAIFIQRAVNHSSYSTQKFTGTAGTGEHIKFVVTPKSNYLFIVSLQENDKIFNFLPEQNATSIQLDTQSTRIELKGSMVFDQFAGQEKLIFLYSQKPLQFSKIQHAALKFATVSQEVLVDAFAAYSVEHIAIHLVEKIKTKVNE